MNRDRNMQRQLNLYEKRKTPSKAVWFGMGYIIYIPEIIRNLSAGANPVCPKPVSRAVVDHMGESERIAEPNEESSRIP